MDGLLKEKKKLTDKPLAFKNPKVSAIVGTSKPIVAASFMVKPKPTQSTVIGHPHSKAHAKRLRVVA